MADCDRDNNSDSLLLQESEDLFQESQDLEVACNVTTCTFPHILAYNQSKQEENDNNNSSQQYISPPLNDFMNMSLEISGKDIIQEISYHRHKIRDFKKILINDYNISPGTVENWINSL